MGEVALDALIDSAKLLPFLFIIYVILEVMEHNAAAALNMKKALSGRWSPVSGAALGLVPQCGFSVAATELFSKRLISVGTLAAIYIAASDEALPVLLANPDAAIKILPLFAIKFVLAVAVGYSADAIISIYLKRRGGAIPQPRIEDAHCCDDEEIHLDEPDTMGCGCKKSHAEKEEKWSKGARICYDYIAVPLWRTFKIWIWIFIVNLLFGAIVYAAGEAEFSRFIADSRFWQPLLAAIVGLIPNCASSVIITQLYAVDTIGLGAAVAGLCVNAGVAPVMLFRKGGFKKGAIIMISLFVVAVAAGYAVTGIETLF